MALDNNVLTAVKLTVKLVVKVPIVRYSFEKKKCVVDENGLERIYKVTCNRVKKCLGQRSYSREVLCCITCIYTKHRDRSNMMTFMTR